VTQRQWRCGLCGKVFKSEQYIDAHLVRRHTDSLPAAGGTCLAEYCDILRCPSWVSASARVHNEMHVRERGNEVQSFRKGRAES
jgi:rubredoxin